LLGLIDFGQPHAQVSAPANATVQARKLFDDYWQWTLREYPEIATAVGDHRYDDRLSDQSAEALERRRAARVEYLDRATKLSAEGLSPADHLWLRILRYPLEQAVALGKLCAPFSCVRGELWSPVTQFYGPQFDVAQRVNNTRFESVRDYQAYLARLAAVPVQIDRLIARMKAEDMLAGNRDIAKRADAELPKLFAELPRLPFGVRAMRPEEGDNTEHYSRGAADGSRAGYFEANVNSLSRRAKWSMDTLVHLRRFHDALIDNGALPLDILEQRITKWIETERGRSP
jgi:uncharacterized protein (DUF885 family)